MTIYLVVPLLMVIAILQATIVPHVTIWGVFPDLPVLIVVNWSLLRGVSEGAVWGFVAGLAVDLLSGAPFGAATLALTTVGLLAGMARATVSGAHLALLLLAMALATIVYDLLFLLVVQVSGQTVAWLGGLWRIVLLSAALNALLTPVVLWGMRLLDRLFRRQEIEL
jgi:rod shape-determining protein MreD